MRIVIVCGTGVGPSILLKMTTEKALRALEIPANVVVADRASAQAAVQHATLVLTSSELADEFALDPARVISVDNFVDEDEVLEKLRRVVPQL